MKTATLKFGGSTFQSLADYARVARHLAERAKTEKLVVVASGFSGMTERLRAMAQAIAPGLSDRTAAALLPLADSVSAQLLCHAAEQAGLKAIGLMAAELGVVTDETWSRARVLELNAKSLKDALKAQDVVTIPGGQAATGRGRQAWLGKNSSDTSAVLAAKMAGSAACEIYSDTPGIYTSDPNLISGVKLVPELPYEQVVELALSGAKVLHYDAVRAAREAGVALVCRRNAGAYEVGTVIGRGRPADLVCPDLRAKVFAFSDERALRRARRALTEKNLPHVVLKGAIAVTCGHSEPEKFLEDAELTGDVLITTLRSSGAVERELVARGRAVARAQEIHDKLIGQRQLADELLTLR